jgi:hypothetical protein
MPLQDDELAPSYEEANFEQVGQNLLRKSGYGDWFKRLQALPHYNEIRRSWRISTRDNFTVRLPPKLKIGSPAEIEELKTFFFQLRHGDLAQTSQTHLSLIDRRLRAGDEDFFRWISKIIGLREKRGPLSYYILSTWLHGFLWGFNNEVRPDVLFVAYQVPISWLTNAPETIRKTVK